MKKRKGFLGARLRQAREARGFTGVRLAEEAGITRQALSKLEKDLSAPTERVEERLIEVLKLPGDFFYRPVSKLSHRGIFFRSLSAATKKARTAAKRKYEWLQDSFAYLQDFVDFPEVRFPPPVKDPLALKDDDIERLAVETRKFYKLGDAPIDNLISLLEENGAVVSRVQLGFSALDAFSTWNPHFDRPFLILSADKESAVRSRADAAHELFHMIAHRFLGDSDFADKETFRKIEKQAKRFSAAFLLPKEPFLKDLEEDSSSWGINALKYRKRKWGASIGMMIVRASQLGRIDKRAERNLWIAMSKRGWRKEEPLDDVLDPEKPGMLREAVELLIDERIQTRSQIRWALPFGQSDIEALCGLERGYLKPKRGRLVGLRKIMNQERMKS